MTLRYLLPTLACVALALVVNATRAGDDDKDFVKLFNGNNLDGFKIVPEKAKDAFTVKNGTIDVSGKPNGYFHTDKSYKNYVLRFEWKFSNDKPGSNSGTLVHITGGHKVWPKSVEVQGMQGDHGNIFAIGGAKGTFKKDAKTQKEAIKLGEWNSTEIICKDGEITSKVNGKQVSTGKGDLVEGPIGFQSEGTAMWYKNIRIKELK